MSGELAGMATVGLLFCLIGHVRVSYGMDSNNSNQSQLHDS